MHYELCIKIVNLRKILKIILRNIYYGKSI